MTDWQPKDARLAASRMYALSEYLKLTGLAEFAPWAKEAADMLVASAAPRLIDDLEKARTP